MQENLFSQKKISSKPKKITWLSHSAFEELNRCPRCFWLSYKEKIKLPEGIKSQLANRFDTILKKYFNLFREKEELPPLIKGKVQGKLQKPFIEKYYFKFNEEYGFYGKLDECLIDEGYHIPIDFKTSSSDPRDREVLVSYQNQIDEYLFLLEQNGKKTAGFGYLIYFFPETSFELSNGFPMVVHIVRIERKVRDIRKRIENAVKVLNGPLPPSSSTCVYCRWFEKVRGYYVDKI